MRNKNMVETNITDPPVKLDDAVQITDVAEFKKLPSDSNNKTLLKFLDDNIFNIQRVVTDLFKWKIKESKFTSKLSLFTEKNDRFIKMNC